jgi:hypothetical protein
MTQLQTNITLSSKEWEDLKVQATNGIKRALIDFEQYSQLLTLSEKRLAELETTKAE